MHDIMYNNTLECRLDFNSKTTLMSGSFKIDIWLIHSKYETNLADSQLVVQKMHTNLSSFRSLLSVLFQTTHHFMKSKIVFFC